LKRTVKVSDFEIASKVENFIEKVIFDGFMNGMIEVSRPDFSIGAEALI